MNFDLKFPLSPRSRTAAFWKLDFEVRLYWTIYILLGHAGPGKTRDCPVPPIPGFNRPRDLHIRIVKIKVNIIHIINMFSKIFLVENGPEVKNLIENSDRK